ncbi:hypothetical protein vBEcoMWL3_gp175 [Escherichia phage vB_EcoM_WL-3]|nr:hypothetical protein vBEcoMWL3_gp175 [Escherichia phage vB_EcoM_WL-3]
MINPPRNSTESWIFSNQLKIRAKVFRKSKYRRLFRFNNLSYSLLKFFFNKRSIFNQNIDIFRNFIRFYHFNFNVRFNRRINQKCCFWIDLFIVIF